MTSKEDPPAIRPDVAASSEEEERREVYEPPLLIPAGNLRNLLGKTGSRYEMNFVRKP